MTSDIWRFIVLSIIKIKLIAVFLTLFMLTACGGGSGNADEESTVMDAADEVMDAADEVMDAADEVIDAADEVMDAADEVLTGRLIDSAVQGVSYSTESISGITNGNGEYTYIQGENVTFSIGDLTLPTVLAQEEITPITLSPSQTIEDNTTVNISRLLQSLDIDNDPTNGLVISDAASAAATQFDFSVTPDEFTENASVINLVANSGSVQTEILSAEIATSHLMNTLGLSGFMRIATLEQFLDLIADRELELTTSEGFLRLGSDRMISGESNGAIATGSWFWENGFWCREISFDGELLFPLDCQVLEVNGSDFRFTRNQGNGISGLLLIR